MVLWQGRKLAVPLAQLTAIAPDQSTDEAIGDWPYWVAQGLSVLISTAVRIGAENFTSGGGVWVLYRLS
jgi:hypothetical protein